MVKHNFWSLLAHALIVVRTRASWKATINWTACHAARKSSIVWSEDWTGLGHLGSREHFTQFVSLDYWWTSSFSFQLFTDIDFLRCVRTKAENNPANSTFKMTNVLEVTAWNSASYGTTKDYVQPIATSSTETMWRRIATWSYYISNFCLNYTVFYAGSTGHRAI